MAEGSVGNNTVPASDSSSGLGLTGSNVAFEDMPKELLKLFKDVEKVVNSIAKTWAGTSKDIKSTSGVVGNNQPGSGNLGLGSFTRTQVGFGLGLAATAGYMSMSPNTMAAVTQRLGADTYAGVSGMSSRQAILQANAQVGAGATSAMGPTMAAMNLFASGYTASSASSKNIMSQIGGLSAMTGMSNEQAAASMGGINGMSFLRAGIRVRDSNGNLRPPNQLINEVYNFLYRGQPITKEQAALVLNPGSKGYQTLLQITGGDSNLMQTLQSGIIARASNGKGLSASQMSSPNEMLNVLGVDQSSPLRANFNYNSSQNKSLAATEQGLVGGYNTSLNVSASLTNGLTGFANLLGPINQGLMNLKGILQTFPNAGGVGGTLSGVASNVVGGAAGNYIAGKMLKGSAKSAPSLLGRLSSFFKGPTGEELVAMVESMGGPSDFGNLGTGIAGQFASGHFVSPVPSGTPVTSPFGPRKGGANMSSNHKGIDFGVREGTSITSTHDGIVKEVGNGGGYGNYVLIQHANGTTARYAHLRQILVSRNQKVSAGQQIGRSGGTPGTPGAGHSTGPHLHFEVTNKGGVKINPAPLLAGAPSSPVSTSKSKSSVSGPVAINSNNNVQAFSNFLGSSNLNAGSYSSPSLSSLMDTAGSDYTGGPISDTGISSSTISKSGTGGATINLNMKVHIAQGTAAEAERMVKLIGQKLKTDDVLKSIARSL